MLRFYAGFFYVQTTWLCQLESQIGRAVRERGQQSPLTGAEGHSARAVLDSLSEQCKPLKLQRAMECLERPPLPSIDARFSGLLSLEKLLWHLQAIRDAIEADLYERTFLFMPPESVTYYDQDDLFGLDSKFPEANREITLAGNCYATGNYTACVFHLTRVLERGLFVLVQDPKMGITITNPKEETWETLINKVEGFIRDVQEQRRSLQKREDLEMYSGAAMQFRYFKDHWRNPISHCRASYDAPQALSAITKVKELMDYLAKIGLKEEPGMMTP